MQDLGAWRHPFAADEILQLAVRLRAQHDTTFARRFRTREGPRGAASEHGDRGCGWPASAEIEERGGVPRIVPARAQSSRSRARTRATSPHAPGVVARGARPQRGRHSLGPLAASRRDWVSGSAELVRSSACTRRMKRRSVSNRCPAISATDHPRRRPGTELRLTVRAMTPPSSVPASRIAMISAGVSCPRCSRVGVKRSNARTPAPGTQMGHASGRHFAR